MFILVLILVGNRGRDRRSVFDDAKISCVENLFQLEIALLRKSSGLLQKYLKFFIHIPVILIKVGSEALGCHREYLGSFMRLLGLPP